MCPNTVEPASLRRRILAANVAQITGVDLVTPTVLRVRTRPIRWGALTDPSRWGNARAGSSFVQVERMSVADLGEQYEPEWLR